MPKLSIILIIAPFVLLCTYLVKSLAVGVIGDKIEVPVYNVIISFASFVVGFALFIVIFVILTAIVIRVVALAKKCTRREKQ